MVALLNIGTSLFVVARRNGRLQNQPPPRWLAFHVCVIATIKLPHYHGPITSLEISWQLFCKFHAQLLSTVGYSDVIVMSLNILHL